MFCHFAGESVPLSPTNLSEIPVNFDPSGSDIEEVLREADVRTLMETPPLDLAWDLLCDSNTFKVSSHKTKYYFCEVDLFCECL